MDHEHLKEFYDAPEDELSFVAASAEALQLQHTMNHNRIHFDRFHGDIIRTHLNRNMRALMPEILDELHAALDDEFIVGQGAT